MVCELVLYWIILWVWHSLSILHSIIVLIILNVFWYYFTTVTPFGFAMWIEWSLKEDRLFWISWKGSMKPSMEIVSCHAIHRAKVICICLVHVVVVASRLVGRPVATMWSIQCRKPIIMATGIWYANYCAASNDTIWVWFGRSICLFLCCFVTTPMRPSHCFDRGGMVYYYQKQPKRTPHSTWATP